MTTEPKTKPKSKEGIERMKLIGFDEKIHYGTLETMPGEAMGNIRSPQLWTDKDGRLCIGILDLNREFIVYDKSKSKSRKQFKPFYISRSLKGEQRASKDGKPAKYLPVSGGVGTFPLIPVQLITRYSSGEKITTLVITEGLLKAFVGGNFGFDIIGIPGITVWKPKEQRKIFKWIEDIIVKCEVTNIVWLSDGDTMTITWEQDKNLSKRRSNFYSSVKLFKQLCGDYDVDLYFKHIREDAKGKGIDDLLLASKKSEIKKIRKELLSTNVGDGEYFHSVNVSGNSYNKLKEYFKLDSVDSFYKQNEKIIGFKKFIWKGSTYEFDLDKEKVIRLLDGDATPFIQVDGQIYRKGGRLTHDGRSEPTIRAISNIAFFRKEFAWHDEPKKKAEWVYRDIPYYHGFTTVPSHTDYQESFLSGDGNGNFLRYYNSYRQLGWNPVPGKFPFIHKMLVHTFGDEKMMYENRDGSIKKEIDQFELGYDYMQLLWMKPKQQLPILVLASKEKNTGKTKFLELCRAIFQTNVKTITLEDLIGNFNDYYVKSLLGQVEETKIEKHQLVEKLKALNTNQTGKHSAKFAAGDEANNYMKIQMTSNHPETLAKIDSDETRFWLRILKTIAKKDLITDMYERMIKEIPFFLYHLQNREMVTEDDFRSYFSPQTIYTEALGKLKKKSKWKMEQNLEDFFKTQFPNSEQTVLKYDLTQLITAVNFSKTPSRPDVKNVLHDRWSMQPTKYPAQYYIYEVDNGGVVGDAPRKFKNRYYTFYVNDFYSFDEIFELCQKGKQVVDDKEIGVYTAEKILQLDAELQKVGRTIWKPDNDKFLDFLKLLFSDVRVYLERDEGSKKVQEMISNSKNFADFSKQLIPF